MEGYDISVASYPRLPGDTGDAERIQRAVNDCKRGVLYIPKGEYAIDQPIVIHNWCSVEMHKYAHLYAAAPMDYLMIWDGTEIFAHGWVYDADGTQMDDMNMFISGGDLDGKGMASCLLVNNYHHLTVKEATFHNGYPYGLRVGTKEGYGYEFMGKDLYFKCTMSGLAGNTAIYSNHGDNHYTDIVSVDYTVGVHLDGGGSNRLTRVHIWGGLVPPPAEGRLAEMLENSICYRLNSGDALLRDCYADTGMIGYLVEGSARLLGCAYYNNWYFKMDNPTVIVHKAGALTVSDGWFAQTSPNAVMYEGTGEMLIWRDNQLKGGLVPPAGRD